MPERLTLPPLIVALDNKTVQGALDLIDQIAVFADPEQAGEYHGLVGAKLPEGLVARGYREIIGRLNEIGMYSIYDARPHDDVDQMVRFVEQQGWDDPEDDFPRPSAVTMSTVVSDKQKEPVFKQNAVNAAQSCGVDVIGYSEPRRGLIDTNVERHAINTLNAYLHASELGFDYIEMRAELVPHVETEIANSPPPRELIKVILSKIAGEDETSLVFATGRLYNDRYVSAWLGHAMLLSEDPAGLARKILDFRADRLEAIRTLPIS